MRTQLLAVLGCGILLAGCASDNTLKLFPGRDGNATGGVAVLDPETEADRGMIDQASSKAQINRGGAPRVGRFDEAALSKRDRALLGFLPPAAKSFILGGFDSGDVDLTPDQVAFVRQQVMPEIARRSGAEVVVIGHASRSGDAAFNDDLSLQRATAVRARIATVLGMAEDHITVAGRGFRDPLPGTDPAAGVNRRVEIMVR